MTPRNTLSRSSAMALAAALIAVTCAIYWPGTAGDFAFDDYQNIVDNRALLIDDLTPASLLDAALSTNTGPTRRPLSMLSFAANKTWWGVEAFGFKVVNIVLHCLNVLLALALMRTLVPRISDIDPRTADWLAVLTVAAFALHPLNLTSVLYVVQRMTLLSSLFMLAALLVYARARVAGDDDLGWRDNVAIFGLVAAGVLCKETAALFFVYVLIIEAFCFRRLTTRRGPGLKLFLGIAIAAVAAIAAFLLFRATDGSYAWRDFALGERLLTQSRVLMSYLHMLVAPEISLFSLYHEVPLSRALLSPPTTLPAVLAVVVMSAVAVFGRPRFAAFGMAWFLGGHLLESTVLPLEMVHEHRNYLPGLGIMLTLFAGLVAALGHACVRPRAVWLLATLYIALLASVTFIRVSDWSDPLRQMAVEARHHPGSARAQYELGRLLMVHATATGQQRFMQSAVEAIERAAHLPSPKPQLALGAMLYLSIDAEDTARVDYYLERALEHPRNNVALNAFRDVVRCQGYFHCEARPEPVLAIAGRLLNDDRFTPFERRFVREWLAVYYLRVLADDAAGLEILEELYAERGQNIDIATRYANALLTYDQPQRAREVVVTALAAQPWYFPFSDRPRFMRLRSILRRTDDGQS